jgi:hypothetical protein
MVREPEETAVFLASLVLLLLYRLNFMDTEILHFQPQPASENIIFPKAVYIFVNY